MDIYEKEKVALIGVNGSGKSTLLKILARLSKETSGILKYYDEDLIKSSGFIFPLSKLAIAQRLLSSIRFWWSLILCRHFLQVIQLL